MQVIIFLCFFASGGSGLIFESIWTRMLTLVFGSTSMAISSVLTAFMGGLALGAWLFGKYADRIRHPLLGYAFAEAVVGLFAFVVPVVINGIYPAINRWLWTTFEPGATAFGLIRFVLVLFVLLIPTTMMGASLPLLARHFTRTAGANVGARVGTLYSVNTFGAVLGTFLAGFWLLPDAGLAWTNRIAGATNLSLAVVIYLFRDRLLDQPIAPGQILAEVRGWFRRDAGAQGPFPPAATARPEPADPPPDSASEKGPTRKAKGKQAALGGAVPVPDTAEIETVSRMTRIAAVAGLAVAGVSAMIYQVVWNRALAMVIGSSIYSFILILLAFLVGLAGGSALISAFMKRIGSAVTALAVVQLMIGLTAIGNYLYLDDMPIFFAKLVAGIQHPEDNVRWIQFLGFVTASVTVLPTTIFMGMAFPLTVKIWSSGAERVGQDVGSVYGFNTVGNIIGSFAAGFILMPVLGMQTSFFIAVALNLVAAMMILLSGEGLSPVKLILTPVVPVVCAVAIIFTPRWNLATMTLGVFRISLASDVISEDWGEPDLVYYHDGIATTVSVERWGRHYALKNNGKVDASNGDDMPTQITVAGYPLVFHPRGPRNLDVAVIGFGSGVTLGTALRFPVKHVSAIELERSIPEAAQFFTEVNHLEYGRSEFPFVTDQGGRLTVINNDGRNFLLSTPQKFDVIISEPSNPWITGVSNLFTVDHFRSAATRLRPGGIFCQWVQLYELAPENIQTIFRTFGKVFPHTVVLAAEDLSSDTVMLGSFDPLPLDLERIRAAMALDGVAQEMERAYIYSPTDVFARVILASHQELMDYTSGALINTDDNALIEFRAPRNLIEYKKYEGYLGTIYSPEWPYARIGDHLRGFGSGPEAAENYGELALSLIAHGKKALAATFVEKAQAAGRSETAAMALEILRLLISPETEPPVPIEAPVPGPELEAAMADRLNDGFDRVRQAIQAGNWDAALDAYNEIPEPLRQHSGTGLRLIGGYLLYKNGEPGSAEWDDAITELEEVVRADAAFVTEHPQVYYYLARAHDGQFNFDKAMRNMRAYVEATAAQSASAGADDSDVPEPALADAPTTDAEGESPKDVGTRTRSPNPRTP
ncbi:MAG: fused MFS/spermidine synthase [Deltaproteobacteria bacterium]|nr:fused MFS/spermidine synthase [Deltaproteobacteria bacterium]